MNKDNQSDIFSVLEAAFVNVRMVVFSISGLISLLIFQWYERGYVNPVYGESVNFVPVPVIYLLSVPLGFMLWVRAVRQYSDHLDKPFSMTLAGLSVLLFTAAILFDIESQRSYVMICAVAGCILALFVFVRWQVFFRVAFKERHLAYIALFAVSVSALYTMLDEYLWEQMAHSAATASYWLMDVLGFELNSALERNNKGQSVVVLTTSNFSVGVYKSCSGLEGIFIFLFLLSAMLLIDWPMFRHIHFTEVYLIGFIYMYCMNVIRIVSLFIFGHFARAPDASPFMASMKGAAIDIFHSSVGQIYYFFAFVLFALVFYHRVARKEKGEVE